MKRAARVARRLGAFAWLTAAACGGGASPPPGGEGSGLGVGTADAVGAIGRPGEPAPAAGGPPLVLGPIDFSPADESAVVVAEEVLASRIAEARLAGSPVSVFAHWVDLNEDGRSDIVGLLGSAYLCGGIGACLFVIENRGVDGYAEVFTIPGVDTVEFPGTRTTGWYDLVTNESGRWRWNGRSYE